jgi:hypothetical protein
VKERGDGVNSNTKMYDDHKTVLIKNILVTPLNSDGKTNHSVFDEKNSLFITERSWSMALNFT